MLYRTDRQILTFVMPSQPNEIPIGARMWFATIGIIAGIAVMVGYLLLGATNDRRSEFSDYLFISVIYAIGSVIGWALIGIPVAIVFPAQLLKQRLWPVVSLVIGAGLGPFALLPVFVIWSTVYSHNFRNVAFAHVTEDLWVFSVLVSTVSFLVYAALLRRRLLECS